MDDIYKGKTEKDIIDIIYTLHLQNTNGRESGEEMFRLGIEAAFEELLSKKWENKDIPDGITKEQEILYDELSDIHAKHISDFPFLEDWIIDAMKKYASYRIKNISSLDLNKCALLIKSMPTGQAIQKIKSKLTGQPETAVISGKLIVIHVDS